MRKDREDERGGKMEEQARCRRDVRFHCDCKGNSAGARPSASYVARQDNVTSARGHFPPFSWAGQESNLAGKKGSSAAGQSARMDQLGRSGGQGGHPSMELGQEIWVWRTSREAGHGLDASGTSDRSQGCTRSSLEIRHRDLATRKRLFKPPF